MANASSSMEWLDPDMDATSGTVALAIVGLFPAVAVLVAVFAQSKTIATFAQLGGLRELRQARTQWTADHPPPLTRLGRALGRGARGGTGRVRSAAEDARVCHLCGREGDPSVTSPEPLRALQPCLALLRAPPPRSGHPPYPYP